jgi:solute carrier family 25 (mitochondrial dicarboxylate transporter), member 10
VGSLDVSQIAPYAAAKRALLARTSLKDDVRTHAIASLVAGTVATTACAPADVLKSRIQSASRGSSVSRLLPSSDIPTDQPLDDAGDW